jgi:hypothetical protein
MLPGFVYEQGGPGAVLYAQLYQNPLDMLFDRAWAFLAGESFRGAFQPALTPKRRSDPPRKYFPVCPPSSRRARRLLCLRMCQSATFVGQRAVGLHVKAPIRGEDTKVLKLS